MENTKTIEEMSVSKSKPETLSALTRLNEAWEEVLDIMNNPYDKTITNLDDTVELTNVRETVQGLIDDLEDELEADAAKAGK